MFPIRDVRGPDGRVRRADHAELARSPRAGRSTTTPPKRRCSRRASCSTASTSPATPAAPAGYLAVVEGYTDVMMAHQCGVPQVVATMGTALNARHVAQLRRYVPKVVLVFDADDGGETGVGPGAGTVRRRRTWNSPSPRCRTASTRATCSSSPDGAETFKQGARRRPWTRSTSSSNQLLERTPSTVASRRQPADRRRDPRRDRRWPRQCRARRRR